MPLYNQIMLNLYYNSSINRQLTSILAFLPLPLLEDKPRFTEPLYTLSNLFHAEVLTPTDLGSFEASLLYHYVPKPIPRDPFAHVLPLRQVEEVI